MNIRIATDQDRDAISRVYLSAFPKGESETVAKVALDLLCDDTTPRTLSLIAESDGSVVGHVAFSPVAVVNNEACQAYILAPLAVQSNYQKRGIGWGLVEHPLCQCK
jgi:putative acetyltransferase